MDLLLGFCSPLLLCQLLLSLPLLHKNGCHVRPITRIWLSIKAVKAETQRVYIINDLKAWMDNGGTLDPKSKRAKKKGKGKEKQKEISHKKGSTSQSNQNLFPDILFQDFAKFVTKNFNSKVSLSTVHQEKPHFLICKD
ncbi:hypothetical protein BDZ97DRAFT_1756327 [Flammula alnicola]|nr:hypothetical protein BDZ97DRAFT_1756327 [Flammula alnicola]